MALNMDRVTEICGQVCKAEAPKFQSDSGEVLGQACVKVLENEKKLLKPLDNPDAWVWKTAWREARRAFKDLRCQSTEFDERAHSLRAAKSQPRDVLDLLVRREDEQHGEEQIERSRAEFDRIPEDQQVAFLVVKGIQACGWIDSELPDSVVGLAALWECSRQHVYNLAERAEGRLRSAAAQSSR